MSPRFPSVALFLVLSLPACGPTTAGQVRLASSDDTASDQRLDEIEALVQTQAAQLAQLQAEVNDQADELTAQAAQLAQLQAEVNDQAAQVTLLDQAYNDLLLAVENLADSIDNDGSGAISTDGVSQGTMASSAGGTSWSTLTARDLEVSADAGQAIWAWCSLTQGSTSGASYRVTIAGDDGYSDDAEVVGDSAYAPLNYSGEALIAWGFWTAPAAGSYTIGCEGKNAAAYDITFGAAAL